MLGTWVQRVVVGVALLSNVALLTGCGGGDPPSLDNVILLSIDTLRRDALRAYSDQAPELPHLDRLAERSVVFLNAHSTASWTLPAHGSMLTGQYPDIHGATAPSRRLRRDTPSLAAIARRAGRDAVGLTDGGYMHQSFGLNHGFFRYDQWGVNAHARQLQKELPRGGARDPRPGSALFDRAIKFLEQRKPGQAPFFLFLQTFSVHDYFLLHTWALERLGLERPEDVDRFRRIADGREAGSDEDWDLMRRLYRAELEHFDVAFGHFLEALEDEGFADNTLLVLVSDHGEGFDTEHDRIHHGGRLHEDLIRVPLMFAGPTLEPRRVETPASLVDLLPTIAELLGQTIPAAVDGVSLADVLRGQEHTSERTLYAMEHHHGWDEGARTTVEEAREDPLQVAVLHGAWWFIDDVDGATELFRMTEDPLQRSPHDEGGSLAELLQQLATARREIRSVGEVHQVPDDVQKQLEELGYSTR